MPTQRFTLIVEGPDLQAEPLIDELFEAGCDDATIGRSDGVQYVDFDREAATLGAAILSAVRDLDQFEGVRVTGIIDIEPAPATDIAAPTEAVRHTIGIAVGAERLQSLFTPSVNLSRSGGGSWLWTDFVDRSRADSDPKVPPSVREPASAWNLIATVPSGPLLGQFAYDRSATSSGRSDAL